MKHLIHEFKERACNDITIELQNAINTLEITPQQYERILLIAKTLKNVYEIIPYLLEDNSAAVIKPDAGVQTITAAKSPY